MTTVRYLIDPSHIRLMDPPFSLAIAYKGTLDGFKFAIDIQFERNLSSFIKLQREVKRCHRKLSQKKVLLLQLYVKIVFKY